MADLEGLLGGRIIDAINGRTCDKCGRLVPRNNDMVWLMVATGLPGYEQAPIRSRSRHVVPVIGETGEELCEGSPSRAQYLPGHPRDKRGYTYQPWAEPIFRSAWQRIQDLGE